MGPADPQDCYRLLGLDPGAGPDEIKKAYKRLAARHHPDRCPDDPQARVRFHRLADAYRVLSDPESRARYDRARRYARPSITDAPAAGASAGWREKLAAFADSYRKEAGPRPRRGRDLLYRLRLDFSDAIQGGGFAVTLPSARRVLVQVPPDTADGSRLIVAGQGDPGLHGGRPGDLLVDVEVVPHPLFRRNGLDLAFCWPVPLPVALLGGEVSVPTLQGSGRVRVPPGTGNGRVLRVAGQGLPSPDKTRTGDLLVEVDVELPAGGGERVQEAFRRLADALDDHHFPRAAEARRRHLP